MANHIALGEKGEYIALEHLKSAGYKILLTNFQAKLGQIDIVAQENGYIVFVEVKTRKDSRLGFPEEAIDYKKKRKLISLAHYFLMKNKLENQKCRFDVVSVLVGEDIVPLQVKIIKDAFWEV